MNSDLIGPLFCGISCILAAILLVAAVVFLVVLNQKRGKQKAVIDPHWESVTGRISTSELEEDNENDVIAPVLYFEYTVDGQMYTGQQVVGRASSLRSKALKTLELYPLDTDIIVHYNPADPQKARIDLR